MNICQHCTSLFTITSGTYGKFCSLSCSSKFNNKIKSQKTLENYLLKPKVCKNCNLIIQYRQRNTNIFCNRSCAATFNNAKKDWANIKTGPKPKPKIPKLKRKIRTNSIPNADGPHTIIYLCTCKFTGKQWYSTTVKTIHPSTISTKKLYSYQCRFVFGINSYSEWFSYASNLIKEHGWYSASNRGNNLSGCSRDHLYSVSEGYKNNIDPKIISHPANCEIIPHRKNQNKHKTSSITLDELKERIRKFNLKYVEMSDGVEPS